MADSGVRVSPKPTSVGSQLCTQCGLCCTGALHDTATAEPDEVEDLRSRGFEVISGEKLRFRLPCVQLKGTRCGIYGDRPQVCSGYRCRLLQSVEDESETMGSALAKVREAWRLFDAVLQLMPAGMTFPQLRAQVQIEPPSLGQAGVSDPRLLLQALALMRYIDQNFRHAKEGPLLSEEILSIDGARASSEKEGPTDV